MRVSISSLQRCHFGIFDGRSAGVGRKCVQRLESEAHHAKASPTGDPRRWGKVGVIGLTDVFFPFEKYCNSFDHWSVGSSLKVVSLSDISVLTLFPRLSSQELDSLIKATIAGGGVIPHIHKSLIGKKTETVHGPHWISFKVYLGLSLFAKCINVIPLRNDSGLNLVISPTVSLI